MSCRSCCYEESVSSAEPSEFPPVAGLASFERYCTLVLYVAFFRCSV